MSLVKVSGNASGTGTLTIAAPNTNSDYTLTLPTATGVLSVGGEIQPISASVASSALTISASALALDFRSTTLGSGTVTTVSGTPANLVISSGSTLGTVSAVASRIVVIALNNAGTIELAAINISGSNILDESALISTTAEGGAGGADSATVVYSTTARTSVAYRVIGFIDSTQATAGTWATAPSTIQGNGGQASVSLAMNASGLAPMFAARAWVNFDGTGTPAIRASGNVTSITDNGVGDYTVNLTTAMPDGNYSASCTSIQNTMAGPTVAASLTTTSVNNVRTINDSGTAVDRNFVTVVIFR